MSERDFAQAVDFWGRLTRATNFALDYWWLWPIVAAMLWFMLSLRSRHALIARLDERAGAADGDVDVLLVERQSLMGNLVEVVRAFANREHDVIRDVLEGRIQALEALSNAAIQTDTQIANVLQNLFTVSEKYPELASADHYSRLRGDLIRIEERITAARKFYNLAVEELNAVQRAFPNNLFARSGAPKRESFTLGVRRVDFDEPVKINL